MTSPAGSIGVGVTIDASDLASEITRAVTSALRPALNAAEGDVSDLAGVLGRISPESILAAADAADRLRRSTDQATNSADGAASANRRFAGSLNEIDATAFNRIARGAQGAEDEIGQLNSIQLNDLIREAERAANELGTELPQGASNAERALRGLDSSSLDDLIRRAREAQQQLGETGDEADDTGSAASRMGDAFGGAVGKVAGLTAGLVGVGGAMATAMNAIEQNSLNNKLTAQLNLTAEESERVGKLAGSLYADNFGASMEDVNAAIGSVQSTIGRLDEDSDAAFSSMVASALTMADVFDVDVAESTQTANNLIRNGLAKDGVEAMDLLTAAMQRMPASVRGEIFPVMDEYSTYFQSLGFSGQEAMGIIVNASQQGQIAMDKAGDAVKEFGIRATDLGDKGAMDAIKSIGLDSTAMANDLLAGGDRAQGAFDKIVAGLQGIDDPAEQASAAIDLFGTPLEDLDKAKIPGFLAGLSGGADAMGDFSGAAENMKDTMAQGPGAAIETVKRSIEQGLVGALGTAAKWMVDNKSAAIALAGAIAGLTAAYAAYRAIAGISAIIQGVSAAMNGVALATNASTTAMRANAVAQAAMNAKQVAGAAITKVVTAAQWAWNAALSANPIGLIVLAIAAVVAALALFFTKTEVGRQVFEKLKEWVTVAWEAIKTAIVGAWNNYIYPALQAIWNFITNTLAPIFVHLWQGVIVPVFNAIVQVITTWWNNWVKPIFDAMVWLFQNVLAPVITWLWTNVIQVYFQLIGAYISFVWNNIIKPVWDGLVWVIQNVIGPLFAWLWTSVIQPTMNGIGAAISFAWNTIIKPVWDALVWLLQNVVGPLFGWLWNTIIKPTMDGIGAVISFAWNNVIKPVLDALAGGWRGVGDLFRSIWENVLKPVWDGFGNLIRSVWEGFISPAFDAIKNGVTKVGDFFSSAVDGIGRVWDGLKSLLAKPINFMIGTVYNNGIRKAWNTVAKFLPGIDEAGELPLIPEHHTGGRINGPKGRDNVLMWGEAGEHMMTVQEVLKAGGHNLVYAMRDMIRRGIPFTWRNGKITPTETDAPGFDPRSQAIQSLGRAVQIGQPDLAPQGLFAAFRPRGYDKGGEIEPWMLQLEKGHKFAKAMSGTPYIAGSNYPTGGDCSGFMSAIANVILGGSGMGGAGHWSTVAFPAGQASVVQAGGQVWHGGLKGNTLAIGMNGGPASGGQNGHTRGTLGAIPDLGYPAVNVESGGGTGGGATYGGGAQSAAGMPTAYHMPIGPNGFFEGGDGSTGPSPEEQRSFLQKKVEKIFKDMVTNPIADTIEGAVGAPPPEFLGIPRKYLDKGVETAVDGAFKIIENIGDGLGAAWNKAKDIGGSIAHAANPLNWFDSGGVANGKGLMSKGVIAPERVLSPFQTELFETLVNALVSISSFSKKGGGNDAAGIMPADSVKDITGRIQSDTARLLDRTETSAQETAAAQHAQQMEVLDQVANQLTEKVLLPTLSAGVQSGMQALTKDGTLNALGTSIGNVAGQIVAASVSASTSGAALYDTGGLWPSGTVGVNLSGSHERVLDPGQTKAFDAGLLGGWNLQPQQQMMAGFNAGGTGGKTGNDTVGADLLGIGNGPLASAINFLVRVLLEVIGVQIAVRQTLTDMASEVRQFRGEFAAFDASGRLTSDTSGLIDRSASSGELVTNERLRILKQIIEGMVKFVVEKIIVPAINALFQGLIQMATTGIGSAIGSAIAPGVGTAAGGAIGNVVGQMASAALGGLAGIGTSLISSILIAGASALLDGAFGLFDDGGIATGVGLMPKATIKPERVLSPQTTVAFDRLVDALTSGQVSLGGGRTTTIHAPFTVVGGRDGGEAARDRLLELLS